MRLNSHLSFDGHCEAAFRSYQRILGGELRTLLRYADSPMAGQVPSEWSAKIVHATLVIGDQELFGSDPYPYTGAMQGFAVAISLADSARGAAIFEALAAGGSVQMSWQETFWSPGFGVLTDRFGVPWEVNCEGA